MNTGACFGVKHEILGKILACDSLFHRRRRLSVWNAWYRGPYGPEAAPSKLASKGSDLLPSSHILDPSSPAGELPRPSQAWALTLLSFFFPPSMNRLIAAQCVSHV